MLKKLKKVKIQCGLAIFLSLVFIIPSTAAAQTANPYLGGISAAPSCNTAHRGPNCQQFPNRTLCLKDRPGAKGRHWVCMYERGKRWVPAAGGTRTRADRALGWEKQNASVPINITYLYSFLTIFITD